MKIRDLTKEAIVVSEDATFHDAVSLMVRKQTNSLLVVDEEGVLSGEITMADLLSGVIPDTMNGDDIFEKFATEKDFGEAVRNAGDKLVSDFMSVDIQPIHVDDSLIAIASTAIANGTQHIPIVDNEDHPIGIISRRGLKHILAKFLNITES